MPLIVDKLWPVGYLYNYQRESHEFESHRHMKVNWGGKKKSLIILHVKEKKKIMPYTSCKGGCV